MSLAATNDRFRRQEAVEGVDFIVTRVVARLPLDVISKAIARVRAFECRADDHRRDFGAFFIGTHAFAFEIRYFDEQRLRPMDPSAHVSTTRYLLLRMQHERQK